MWWNENEAHAYQSGKPSELWEEEEEGKKRQVELEEIPKDWCGLIWTILAIHTCYCNTRHPSFSLSLPPRTNTGPSAKEPFESEFPD